MKRHLSRRGEPRPNAQSIPSAICRRKSTCIRHGPDAASQSPHWLGYPPGGALVCSRCRPCVGAHSVGERERADSAAASHPSFACFSVAEAPRSLHTHLSCLCAHTLLVALCFPLPLAPDSASFFSRRETTTPFPHTPDRCPVRAVTFLVRISTAYIPRQGRTVSAGPSLPSRPTSSVRSYRASFERFGLPTNDG